MLCDPSDHAAIDSSVMPSSASGGPVGGVGDSYVVHMDGEVRNDRPQGE